jgi:hypothetical protein
VYITATKNVYNKSGKIKLTLMKTATLQIHKTIYEICTLNSQEGKSLWVAIVREIFRENMW